MLAAPQRACAKKDQRSYNITRAVEEASEGNYSKAIEFIDQELSDHPKNGEAYVLKAAIEQENEDYGAMRSDLELALKYLPSKEKDLRAHALRMRGIVLALEGDTIGAYADLASAIKLLPNDEDGYEMRAQLLYEQGRYDESDADYAKIAELNPGGVLGRMGIGRNAKERGDYDGAIAQFDKIITLHPDYSSGYSFRADAYMQQGKYLQAATDICRALEIDSDNKAFHLMFDFPKEQLPVMVAKLKALSAKEPHSGEYDYYIAALYQQNGKHAEAVDMFQRAYDKDAKNAFLQLKAESLNHLGRYDEALTTVEKALNVEPEDNDLLVLRAETLANLDDFDGAIAQWDNIIELNPDSGAAFFNRGVYEFQGGRPDPALADFDMAVMLGADPQWPKLFKADVLAMKGDSVQAKELYKEVAELDSTATDATWRIYAIQGMGRSEEAKAMIRELLAADSTNTGNLYDAACLAARRGEYTEAIEYLQEAVTNGYSNFPHMRRDIDLKPLHDMPEFQELIQGHVPGFTVIEVIEEDGDTSSEAKSDVKALSRVEVPFTPLGGVTEVACKINDLPLKFIFDTGAADVTMSMVEANFMVKNGYIKPSDFVGSQYFLTADGSVSEGTIINLREIELGGLKLNNVKASVVRNQKAPLLLGQSVLGRLGKIEIDNAAKKLIITQ